MKTFFKLPELLLLLLIPMVFFLRRKFSFNLNIKASHFIFDAQFMFGLAIPVIIISWVLHVCLRIKRSFYFPSFGSWFQVLLTAGCWMYLVVICRHLAWVEASHVDTWGDINTILIALTAPIIYFILLAFQLIFWIFAVRKLLKKGPGK